MKGGVDCSAYQVKPVRSYAIQRFGRSSVSSGSLWQVGGPGRHTLGRRRLFKFVRRPV